MIGRIELQPPPRKLRIEGKPVALVGDATIHCGMGPGAVATGSRKVYLR
jgi:uncharacterized Zn-binding protein involved in type VI secretion